MNKMYKQIKNERKKREKIFRNYINLRQFFKKKHSFKGICKVVTYCAVWSK
jgi:hypothetical protein